MARLYTDVELRDPARLTPYPHNTKKHPQAQIDRLAGQIAAHGFDQPIVVDKEGVIVKGHGRRQAAMQLGLSEVPVMVTDMDEHQARAARIADNQLVSLEYDTQNLEVELKRLRESELDLSLTGMDDAQLGALLAGGGEAARDDAARAQSSQAPASDAHPRAEGPEAPPPRAQNEGGEALHTPGDGGNFGEERFTYVVVGRRKIPATGEEVEGLLDSLKDYESDNGTTFGFWTAMLR